MLFHSPEFVLLLLVLLAGFAVFHRHQPRKVLLLIASAVFYGWWNPAFLLLIGMSTAVDFGIGAGMEAARSQARRRALLVFSVAFNLGVLAVFKYANFFQENLLALWRLAGHQPGWTAVHVVLPLGISFYTFQTMSYTIDVYRREIPATRSPLDFALFVSFFPQLIAGPIVRARDFLPQLERPIRVRLRTVDMTLILRGLVKKVLIADNLATFVDAVFAEPGRWPSVVVITAVAAFMVQAYCDFSGYSDMAIGLARIFGFRFPWNFRWPFFALNPTDFWRRWHISFTTWLRDYLYIPLGGSRRGRWMAYRNVMITMLLAGLWHGAAWNFVLWGASQAVLSCAYLALTRGRRPPAHRSATGKVAAWVAFFFPFFFTWAIFRAHGWADIVTVFRKMFFLDGNAPLAGGGLARIGLVTTAALLLGFAALHARSYRVRGLHRVIAAAPMTVFLPFCFVAGFILFLLWPDSAPAFIYFQF